MKTIVGTSSSASSRTGFTIVELLIVVVVLAILAALSVVIFKDTNRRTSNARTISNVETYHKAIMLYRLQHGKYPTAPGEGTATVTMTCLGLGYPDGTCGIITGTTVYESASFMNDLSSKSGSGVAAIVNDRVGPVGNESFTGAAYGIDTTDPAHSSTGRARMIEWFLAGTNQDCVLPGSWAYNTSHGNTACELDIEEYPSS